MKFTKINKRWSIAPDNGAIRLREHSQHVSKKDTKTHKKGEVADSFTDTWHLNYEGAAKKMLVVDAEAAAIVFDMNSRFLLAAENLKDYLSACE